MAEIPFGQTPDEIAKAPEAGPESTAEQAGIVQFGSVCAKGDKLIHCLTIIGQIEGISFSRPRTKPPNTSM